LELSSFDGSTASAGFASEFGADLHAVSVSEKLISSALNNDKFKLGIMVFPSGNKSVQALEAAHNLYAVGSEASFYLNSSWNQKSRV
jgi:hypothetical protein